MNDIVTGGGMPFDVYAPQTSGSVSQYIFNMDEDIMASLYHFLRGEMPVVVSDGSKEVIRWQKLRRPLMTDEGIRFVLNVIRGQLSNVSIVSSLSEKVIIERYLNFRKWLQRALYINYDLYFPTDDTKHLIGAYHEVMRVVSDIVFYMLFAIKEGRIFKGVTTTTQEVHQYSHEEEGGAVFFKKR